MLNHVSESSMLIKCVFMCSCASYCNLRGRQHTKHFLVHCGWLYHQRNGSFVAHDMASSVSATVAKEPRESENSADFKVKVANQAPQISTIPSPSRPATTSVEMEPQAETGLRHPPPFAPPPPKPEHTTRRFGLENLESDNSQSQSDGSWENEEDGENGEKEEKESQQASPSNQPDLQPESVSSDQGPAAVEPRMPTVEPAVAVVATAPTVPVPKAAKSQMEELLEWKAQLDARENKLRLLEQQKGLERAKIEKQKQAYNHNVRALEQKDQEARQQRDDVELRLAELNFKQIELAHKQQQLLEKEDKLLQEEEHLEIISRQIIDDRNQVHEKKDELRRKEQNYQAKLDALTKRQQMHRKVADDLAHRERKYDARKKELEHQNPMLVQEIRRLSSILDSSHPVVSLKPLPKIKPIPPAPTAPPSGPAGPETEADNALGASDAGSAPEVPYFTGPGPSELTSSPETSEREQGTPPVKAPPMQPQLSPVGRGQILDASWGPAPTH